MPISSTTSDDSTETPRCYISTAIFAVYAPLKACVGNNRLRKSSSEMCCLITHVVVLHGRHLDFVFFRCIIIFAEPAQLV